MSKRMEAKEAAAMLAQADNIAILCHKNPDGDTIGCGFAMYYALTAMGKKAMVCCSNPFPKKYDYITCDTPTIPYDFVLAVDVADEKLLGDGLDSFKGKIDLCVDHHPSNGAFAQNLCLRADYGAACQLVYDILSQLPVMIDVKIADCLYTGIATDTGCLRYSNTGIHTLETAAALLKIGAHTKEINNALFETKTKSRLAVEQMALEGLTYHCGDRCAVIAVTTDMLKKSGATSDELEGVAAIPRQIEGVDVGITIRQQGESHYKVSLRTSEAADASAICGKFGGGGHARAAGCEWKNATLEEVRSSMVEATQQYLEG